MRKLTVKQKKLLDKQLLTRGIWTVEAIPYSVWEEIESLNDYETLWQDADRYLWDKYYARRWKNERSLS